MVKKKNGTGNKILTIVFVFSIVIGFYLVSVVNGNYTDKRDIELLYQSDSTTEFLTLTANPLINYNLMTTGIYDIVPDPYIKLPVYLGNETWSMSVNDTSYSYGYAMFVVALPNLDSWIIDNMVFNITKGAPSDESFAVWIVNSKTIGILNGNTDIQLKIFEDNVAFALADGYYNRTIDLTLNEALEIHDLTNNGVQPYMLIRVRDQVSPAGLEAFAFTFKMTMEGRKVDTYNIIQQLEVALFLSTSLNILCIVYMTDEIDIGGYINDIPDNKRR